MTAPGAGPDLGEGRRLLEAFESADAVWRGMWPEGWHSGAQLDAEQEKALLAVADTKVPWDEWLLEYGPALLALAERPPDDTWNALVRCQAALKDAERELALWKECAQVADSQRLSWEIEAGRQEANADRLRQAIDEMATILRALAAAPPPEGP